MGERRAPGSLIELPFDSGSLDLVVMPHVLEFYEHPHHILREVERVLRPEGNIIISGFNPRSLWGASRAGKQQGYPWNGNFIALPRMKDWLALLGLRWWPDVLPVTRRRLTIQRMAGAVFVSWKPAGDRWWAVCGGVYFLQAIKRVHGMRLIKPKWNEGLVGKLMPARPN